MRNLAFVLLAACSGSDPAPLEFDVTGPPPALFAYRDGSGAWQTATGDAAGHYMLKVTDDYQVVVACIEDGAIESSLVSATVEDGPRQSAACDAPVPESTTTYLVTGTMKQPGTVFAGGIDESATPNWTIHLDVPPGTHDVVAIDDRHRMLMRRRLAIAGATTLDPIDLTGALTMMPIRLQIANAGSDSVDTSSGLSTANGAYTMSSSSAKVWMVPASLLESGDVQHVAAFGDDGHQFRVVLSTFTGSETSFTLPDAVTGVTFGTATASWSAMPAAYDDATLVLDQTREQTETVQSVRATKRWLAATHATKLTFDAQPPGFQTAWNVDTTATYSPAFHADYVSGNTQYEAVVFGDTERQRSNRPLLSMADRLRESMRSRHPMSRM
jgi:hypothetical protein